MGTVVAVLFMGCLSFPSFSIKGLKAFSAFILRYIAKLLSMWKLMVCSCCREILLCTMMQLTRSLPLLQIDRLVIWSV